VTVLYVTYCAYWPVDTSRIVTVEWPCERRDTMPEKCCEPKVEKCCEPAPEKCCEEKPATCCEEAPKKTSCCDKP
jgi:hypothetical protein